MDPESEDFRRLVAGKFVITQSTWDFTKTPVDREVTLVCRDHGTIRSWTEHLSGHSPGWSGENLLTTIGNHLDEQHEYPSGKPRDEREAAAVDRG
jgi:hypothetical protein